MGLLACLVASAAVIPAPDVQYTMATKFTMAGAAGKAINFLARLGGASTESTESVYVSGSKMLTKSDDFSSLIDLDARQMVTIDHKQKTYSVLGFDDFQRQMEHMMEQGKQAIEEAESEMEEDLSSESTGQDPDVEAKVHFDVSVNPTGKRSQISGLSAQNYLLTISALTEATVEEEGKQETYEGTFVIASDLWLSKDFDGYQEVEAFNRRFAEVLGEEFVDQSASLAEAMQQAFAGDPRMEEGFEKARMEAEKLEGAEVKNTTYFVLVAEGETFNPDLLFGKEETAEKPEKKRGRGLLGRIAREVANIEQPQEDEPSEPVKQQVLFTVTTEMRDFSTAPVPASVFEIPSGYREVAYGSSN